MNIWKTMTFVFAAFLLFAIFQWRQAEWMVLEKTDAANKKSEELLAYISAVNDCQAFLNWYRIIEKDRPISAEILRKNVEILQGKYLNHFPKWAERQRP